jgi:hypothetical protein
MPATTHSIRPIFSTYWSELAARRDQRVLRRQVRAELRANRTPFERNERDIILSEPAEEKLAS